MLLLTEQKRLGVLMQVYILLAVDKLEAEQLPSLQSALPQMQDLITAFIAERPALQAELIVARADVQITPAFEFGIRFHIKQKKHLAEPIALFNRLAEQFQQDFVIGLWQQHSREDISFFGFEAGLGDSFMIAEYLFL